MINNQVILPGAGYIELLHLKNKNTLSDIQFMQPFVFEMNDNNQIDITQNSIVCNDNTFLNYTESETNEIQIKLTEVTKQCNDIPSFYQTLSRSGLNYGPNFQTICSIFYNTTHALVSLETKSELRISTLFDVAF